MSNERAQKLARGQERLNQMRSEVSQVLLTLYGLRDTHQKSDACDMDFETLPICVLPRTEHSEEWDFHVSFDSAWVYCDAKDEVVVEPKFLRIRNCVGDAFHDAEEFPPEVVIIFHEKLDEIIAFFLKHTRDRPEIGQLLSTLEKLGEDE